MKTQFALVTELEGNKFTGKFKDTDYYDTLEDAIAAALENNDRKLCIYSMDEKGNVKPILNEWQIVCLEHDDSLSQLDYSAEQRSIDRHNFNHDTTL